MTEWIKCSDRMPDSDPDYRPHKRYITFDGIDIGLSSYDIEWIKIWGAYGFTHWMIPPKSPEQIEKEREEYENSDYCKALSKYSSSILEGFARRYNLKSED